MTDGQPVFDEEAIQNQYDQLYDLYLEDALNNRGLTEDDLESFQIVFRSPFKTNQFQGLKGGDSDVEVRINDEVEAVMKINANRDIKAGEEVKISDIEEIVGIHVHDLGDDVGHITYVWRGGELFTGFNFLYNQEYLDPLLETADEFIKLATISRENEMWRAFAENAFHAAERMMKWRVVQHGDAAFNHDIIRRNYSKYVDAGLANEDLLEEYKQLKDNYRYPGVYVDPGTHLDGIDEKKFELDPEVADRIVKVIVEHRKSIGD